MNLESVKRYRDEIIIGISAAILAGVTVARVYSLHLVTALVDQNSHLNISRQIIDSMTPGISQLGTWPPLLHLILLPFVAIDPLYRSGLAGFAALLPFLIMASVYLYKLVRLITRTRWIAIWSAAVFMANPYILYYTATPMMEVLFIANLFAAAYYLTLWMKTGRLSSLLACGVLISLATVSRFEGIFLIPVTGMLILVQLIRKRTPYRQVEALTLLFGLLAIGGFVSLLAYGYLFGGHPLSFMNSQWSAYSQQRDYFLPTQGNPLLSLTYFIHASYHLLTIPIVIGALALTPVLFLLLPAMEVTAAVIVLFTPFLFDFTALIRGNAIVYTPELPPYGTFFNERYGLYWIGFALVVPALVAFALVNRRGKSWPDLVRSGSAAFILTVVTVSTVLNLIVSEVSNPYTVIRQSAQGYPSKEQTELALVLRKRYDFGKVLMTRALHDFVAVNADIPLKNYLHESNFKYYDQALERPWLFARWVVMFNPDDTNQDKWASRNEKVSRKWGASPEFTKYYSLVMDNKRERLYKINPEAVIAYAQKEGYEPARLPSLNPALTWWNPDTVYASLRLPVTDTVARGIVPLSLSVKIQLPSYYETYLRPQYARGFYQESDGTGTSESQSYALLQSVWMDDRKTFDTVWNWTKTHIQHDTDHLFSWTFTVGGDGAVSVPDKNSATDADTDIAYALLLAGQKWKDDTYVREAKPIITGIWQQETAVSGNARLVTAGNWAAEGNNIVTNPSYFSPSAYRMFARVDPVHDWERLVSDGYEFLTAVTEKSGHPAIFVPPNWIAVSKKDGVISPISDRPNATDYSYDAFRTFWRISMDQKIQPSPPALAYLYRADIFSTDFTRRGDLCSIYLFSKGGTCTYNETTSAGPLSVLAMTSPKLADQFVEKAYLTNSRLKDPSRWSFFQRSWYWFGLGLYSGYFSKQMVRPAPEQVTLK